MIFGLFVGVWVARYLGPKDFGILSYSLSFVAFFLPIASLGLNHIITRDLVREREHEEAILGTAFLLRLFSGFITTIIAITVIHFLRGQNEQIAWFVGCLSLAQSLKAFHVIDFWYQSYTRSKYMVISRILSLLLSNSLKIIAILYSASLAWFIAILVFEYSITESFKVVTYILQGNKPWMWKFKRTRAKYYLFRGWPLIISGFAAIIYLKIDIIMIGQMLSDSAVGIYSSAVRISEVWYIIPTAILTSLFPWLIKSRSRNLTSYNNNLQKVYNLLAIIGLSIAILVTFFAQPLMTLLYGKAYQESAYILQIHIWAGVFVFMRALFSKWILTEELLKASLMTQGGGAILNILANLLLIPYMGIKGAAIATLISYIGASYFILFFHRLTRPQAVMMSKALLYPLIYLSKTIRRK